MQGFVDAFSSGSHKRCLKTARSGSRFGVPYQPAWVFVNDDGTAQVVHGVLSEPDLEATLDQLIGS